MIIVEITSKLTLPNFCKNEISFDIYQQLIDHLNMSEFLAIHLYTRDDDLENIFYYKGTPQEPFKMCCEEACMEPEAPSVRPEGP